MDWKNVSNSFVIKPVYLSPNSTSIRKIWVWDPEGAGYLKVANVIDFYAKN